VTSGVVSEESTIVPDTTQDAEMTGVFHQGVEQTLAQLKETALAEMGPQKGKITTRGLGGTYDEYRDRIRAATSAEEVMNARNEAFTEADVSFEETVLGSSIGFSGSYAEQQEKQAIAETAKASASQEIKDFVDQLLLTPESGLDKEDVVVAYGADSLEEAIANIYEAMGEKGASSEQYDFVGNLLGDEAVLGAIAGKTLEGAAAKEEALRSRFGYTGELSEAHEWMIEHDFMVQFDIDNNIYYIEPGTLLVQDVTGKAVGKLNPMTQNIDFLQYIDARAPIGIETGAYGTAQEGAMSVNIVAGRTQVSLTEWFKLYGNDMIDAVTGKDYEQVLIDALGIQGMLNYRTNLARQAMSRVDFDVDVAQEAALGDFTVGLHYQYLAGENINKFIDMPLEEFTEWQKKYEAMGIGYTAKKYGRFDQHFLEIVSKTMVQANLDKEGDPKGFENIMDEMMGDASYASNLGGPRGGGTSRVWRPPAYLAPDYAEISQAVKATFEQRLGRAPSDAEIVLLSKKMGADHRGEFDAQVQAQKLQFFGAGGTDAGTVQDVNYAARFQEDFASKYEDQLATLDKIDQSRSLTQNALGSILSADRAAGY